MAAGQLGTHRTAQTLVVGLTLIFWASVSFSRVGDWLEATLVGHVLIEIPMLVAIGVVLGDRYRQLLAPWWASWNGGGIAGILIASFTVALWMIPRWLDASLTETSVAIAKYLSLPMLVGLPLAMSWARLHPIARAVVKIEFLTMLLRLGWLYLISPDRWCNNYLLNEQVWLGQGFLIVAVALAITWLIPIFFGSLSVAKVHSRLP